MTIRYRRYGAAFYRDKPYSYSLIDEIGGKAESRFAWRHRSVGESLFLRVRDATFHVTDRLWRVPHRDDLRFPL